MPGAALRLPVGCLLSQQRYLMPSFGRFSGRFHAGRASPTMKTLLGVWVPESFSGSREAQ